MNSIESYFKDLYKQKKLLNFILHTIIDTIFWLLVFAVIYISYFAAANIFHYDEIYDHHLAFFLFLSGMAANGYLPGIDFYSPHSTLIPIIIGMYLKIVGINQVNLCIGVGICVFITYIFVYKTARFILPEVFAKLAIAILLLTQTGRDLPWFNDVIMMFVAIGVYIFSSYINEKRPYKLILLGIICFILPLLRQQGFVMSFCFLILPMILYHTKAITKYYYKDMLLYILSSFLASIVIFIIFILFKNGTEGLEILTSSMTTLVGMAQPQWQYSADILDVLMKILNYTENGRDWHNGTYMRWLSYWFIVILPSLYYLYNLFRLSYKDDVILNADVIKFVTSLLVLSTIVFNYPINEEMRLRLQFGIGIWLFVEAIRVIFYDNKAKLPSIVAIILVLLSINFTKIIQFQDKLRVNYFNTLLRTKAGNIRMDKDTPYANLILREDRARQLISLTNALEEYEESHPDKKIIFDGELESINQYLSLLFTSNNVALAHKFPYYYEYYDREKFMPDIKEKFLSFVNKNKPIIIGCTDTPKAPNYKILRKLNDKCQILVPIESNEDSK